jgi:hypothetical protein
MPRLDHREAAEPSCVARNEDGWRRQAPFTNGPFIRSGAMDPPAKPHLANANVTACCHSYTANTPCTHNLAIWAM